MTDFLPVICAAGGQHEEHTVLRSPAKNVVNKNSSEPQAAHLEGFGVKNWLILLVFCGFSLFFSVFC
ncbi:MAG: hypothetical protein GY845_22130 [Planctomycetes bacterium]|nr:hypothetical protein [Planctomycetota bacterium]